MKKEVSEPAAADAESALYANIRALVTADMPIGAEPGG